MPFAYIIGISRSERWERAKRFDFNPPDDIKVLIENHSTDERYTQRFVNVDLLASLELFIKIAT